MNDLWAALALVLVIEGLLPALTPNGYRKMAMTMMTMDERSLRMAGLMSMIAGAAILYLVKH